MATIDLKKFSHAELIQKLEQTKQNKIIQTILIGLGIGIAIYCAVSGRFLYTLFLLIVTFYNFKNLQKSQVLQKEIKAEINERN